MIRPSVAIIAPVHIQPSKKWVDALVYAGRESRIIIVDDSNGRVSLPKEWDVYPYDRQKEYLGESWFSRFRQFHKSPPCKNFGIWKAWKDGADVIMVIDSDCIVPEDFVERHMAALSQRADGWENPLHGTGWHSRGLPYYKRHSHSVDLHMGLWTEELDVYGKDRVEKGIPPKTPQYRSNRIAHGMVPLSGMNLAFRRDVAPALMFVPHFDHGDWKFRRHDDIWGGYILQKIMQRMGAKLSYGTPFVYHDTEVKPEIDAQDEEAMIHHEELFYDAVDAVFETVSGADYQTLFKNFVTEAKRLFPEKYSMFVPMLDAHTLWVEKFA